MNRPLHSTFVLAILLFGTIVIARADDPCQKGKEALSRGDLQEAISLLREGTQKDKKNKECFFNLATALLKADSADQAVGAFIQARELDTADVNIYLGLGDAYKKQGIHTAAVEQYLAAARRDSMNPTVWKKIATEDSLNRDYNSYATHLLRVAALDTTDIGVFRSLAKLYLRAKNVEKALPYYKYIFDHNPNDSTRLEYVTLLDSTKRYTELIPVASAIVKSDSSQKGLLRMLFKAYSITGDRENAGKVFQSMKGSMTCKDMLDNAKNLKAENKSEEAIPAFESVLQCGDTTLYKDVYYDLGTLYMNAKDYDKAIGMLVKVPEVDTTTGILFAAHYDVALCLMQLKEFDKAKTHLLKSIEFRPGWIGSWRALGISYGQIEQYGKAVEAYDQMEKMIDTSATREKMKDMAEEGYRLSGLYLLQDKKFPQAIEHLLKALKYNSGSGPVYCQTTLWLAQGYHNNKQREEAKKYYCKVLNNCGKEEKLHDQAEQGLAGAGGTSADCK